MNIFTRSESNLHSNAPRFVLTAAHCMSDTFFWEDQLIIYVPNEFNPTLESTFKVYLGLHDVSFIFMVDPLPENAVNPSVSKVIIVILFLNWLRLRLQNF